MSESRRVLMGYLDGADYVSTETAGILLDQVEAEVIEYTLQAVYEAGFDVTDDDHERITSHAKALLAPEAGQ